MNLHENTEFGRKVFFINPRYDFSRIVVPGLIRMEYESYIIENYKKAKEILKKYPDSICYVYIDTQMRVEQWFNFVTSFEKDPMLSTIFLGIISKRITQTYKEYFLLHTTIPAGFIELKQSFDDIIDTIKGILDLNGAKGRRRYIRADCRDDEFISATFQIGKHPISTHLNNISSAGISCYGQSYLSMIFTPNMLIRDIILSLHGKEVRCSGAVFLTALNEEETTIVLIFTQTVGFTVKSSIKEYIYTYLQGKLNDLMSECKPDETDYPTVIGFSSTRTLPAAESTKTDDTEPSELEPHDEHIEAKE